MRTALKDERTNMFEELGTPLDTRPQNVREMQRVQKHRTDLYRIVNPATYSSVGAIVRNTYLFLTHIAQ